MSHLAQSSPRLARRCRCTRILHLKPIGRAAGTVSRALPLRHDTFEPHLTGMGEDGRAVALDMLVEPDAGASLGQHTRKRGLADLKRIARQVIAIQLDQVESVQKHPVVSAVVTNEIERGNAVVIAAAAIKITRTALMTASVRLCERCQPGHRPLRRRRRIRPQ